MIYRYFKSLFILSGGFFAARQLCSLLWPHSSIFASVGSPGIVEGSTGVCLMTGPGRSQMCWSCLGQPPGTPPGSRSLWAPSRRGEGKSLPFVMNKDARGQRDGDPPRPVRFCERHHKEPTEKGLNKLRSGVGQMRSKTAEPQGSPLHTERGRCPGTVSSVHAGRRGKACWRGRAGGERLRASRGSRGSFLGGHGHERGICVEALASGTPVEAWIWERVGQRLRMVPSRRATLGVCEGRRGWLQRTVAGTRWRAHGTSPALWCCRVTRDFAESLSTLNCHFQDASFKAVILAMAGLAQ